MAKSCACPGNTCLGACRPCVCMFPGVKCTPCKSRELVLRQYGPHSMSPDLTARTYSFTYNTGRIWDYPKSLLDKSNKRIDIKIRHNTLDSDFGAYITTDKGEEIDITAKSLDELFNLITLRFP